MQKVLLILAVLFTTTGFAQNRKSPHDTVSTRDVSVTYGRPSMHGRIIFGELVKYEKVWRLGSDEATTITLGKNTKIGDAVVPAGTYTMFALVKENEWTIIFNSVLGQWGAFSYEKNKDKNVATATFPVKKLSEPIEQFTIRFDADNGMIVEWELMRIRIAINPQD